MKLKQLFEVKYGKDINLGFKHLTELPSYLPEKVEGYFYCHNNYLTSLEHCPSEVGGAFFCAYNHLTSLKDVHKRIRKIGKSFQCYDNPIKSHILGLMLIEIGGKIETGLGDGKDVDVILNKWKNQGRKGALGCQRELIEAGYKDLAQL